MSYTIISRKYRPQNFDELIGQKPIAETLANAIKKDKISQAYLFTGPRGVGKTSTARILSKALNCESGPTPHPCNVCRNCLEITNGNSLDVIEIDGASNRGIDEIRDLKEKVNFAPVSSKYKIYIIDEVHMLTEPAFNALLKTLEEPPPHIVFIFATTEPYKIPATVLSRCQRYDFRRISIQEIVQQLKKIAENEKVSIDDEALFLIAKNSDGSLRDAQSALDQLIAFSEGKIVESKVRQLFGIADIEVYQSFAEAIIESDITKGIRIITDIYNSGADLKQFVVNIIEFFRNIAFVKLGIDEVGILEESKDKIGIFKKLSKEFEPDVLQEMIIYITSLLNSFRYTSQFKTLLEIGLLNLVNIYKKVSLRFIYDFIKEFAEEEIKNTSVKEVKKEVAQKVENSIEETDVLKKWKEVVNKIESNNKWTGQILGEGRLLDKKDNQIIILFDKKFNFDSLNDEATMEKIRKVASEVFKTKMDIKFVVKEEKKDLKNKIEDEIQIPKRIFNATIIKKE